MGYRNLQWSQPMEHISNPCQVCPAFQSPLSISLASTVAQTQTVIFDVRWGGKKKEARLLCLHSRIRKNGVLPCPSPLPIAQAQWEGWALQPSLAASHPCAGAGSTRAHSIPGFNSLGQLLGYRRTTHHSNRLMGQPSFPTDNEPV